jgi:hypothetical protein
MISRGVCKMCPDDGEAMNAEAPKHAGRPRLDRPRRVRITTTIEPSKLALLQEHAQRQKKSLGELADEYVQEHLFAGDSTPE